MMVNIASLCIAILEGKVSQVIGEDAVKELKQPLIEANLQREIAEATQRAEQRFIEDYPDREISNVVRLMPLADLPIIQSSIRKFYENPTDPLAKQTFHNQLRNVLGTKVETNQIEDAVADFMEHLRLELINIDDLRERLSALSIIENARHSKQAVKELEKIRILLEEHQNPPPKHRLGNAPHFRRL